MTSDRTRKVFDHRPTDHELARVAQDAPFGSFQRIVETPESISAQTRSLQFCIPLVWAIVAVAAVGALTQDTDWLAQRILGYFFAAASLILAIVWPFVIREIDRDTMRDPPGFEWQRHGRRLVLNGHADIIDADRIVEIVDVEVRRISRYLLVCSEEDGFHVLPLRAMTSRRMRRAIRTIADEADAEFREIWGRTAGI